MRKTMLLVVAVALVGATWAAPAHAMTKSLIFEVKQMTPAGAGALRANVKKVAGVASAIVNTKDKTVTVTIAPGKSVTWTHLTKAVTSSNEKWSAGMPTAAVAGKLTIRVANLNANHAKRAQSTLEGYKATDKVTFKMDKGKSVGTTFQITFQKGKNLKFSTVWSAFTSAVGKEKVKVSLMDAWFYGPEPKKKKKKG